MKLPTLLAYFSKRSRAARILPLALQCLVMQAVNVHAQDVVAPLPQYPVVPTAVQAVLNSSQTPDASSEEAVAATTPELAPFQAGPVSVLPHFLYRFLYGNGILAAPGHPSVTAINTVSPGVLFDLGSQWSLDYTASADFYSNSAFRTNVDQAVDLTGANTYDNWAWKFSQLYNYSSQPLVETGLQTTLTEYLTALKASYSLNSKVSIDTSLNQDYRITSDYPTTIEWSTLDMFNYHISPLLSTGLGVDLGYVDVSSGMNQFYVAPEAQITLRATDKITVNLSGGVQHREFIGGTSGTQQNIDTPIFDISLQYQPQDSTKLTIGGGQAIEVSYFENQNTKNTNLRIALDQRLLEHFYLSASVERGRTEYLTSTDVMSSGRDDNDVSYNVRLSTTFIRRGTISILYQRFHNSSNFAGYEFTSNQTGFELGYRF